MQIVIYSLKKNKCCFKKMLNSASISQTRLKTQLTAMTMDKILILLAHPRFERSRAGRILHDAAEDLPFVTVHDLYELYPDFNIDKEREQALLLEYSILVWQYPIYMYNTPSILKQWIDIVLEHGWAHGKGGGNLKNKLIFSSVTTGGSRESYGPEGFNRYRLPEFIRPLEQTASLCNMVWLPPFAVQGVYLQSDEQMARHADLYRKVLERLSAGTFVTEHISRHEYLNDWISSEERQDKP